MGLFYTLGFHFSRVTTHTWSQNRMSYPEYMFWLNFTIVFTKVISDFQGNSKI